MRYAIWYHFYNFENVKNTVVLLLVSCRLQALLKVTLLHEFTFFKLYKRYQISQSVPYRNLLDVLHTVNRLEICQWEPATSFRYENKRFESVLISGLFWYQDQLKYTERWYNGVMIATDLLQLYLHTKNCCNRFVQNMITLLAFSISESCIKIKNNLNFYFHFDFSESKE